MAFDIASIGAETLLQYGAIGALLGYFLILDHIERKRKNTREDTENKARAERDAAAAKREEACIKSNQEIRKHQMDVIAPLLKESNQLHRITIAFLKNKKFNTPLPDIPAEIDLSEDNKDDDETRIINRRR